MKTNHRRLALFKGYPAVLTGQGHFAYRYGFKSADELGYDPNRTYTVVEPGSSYFDVKTPITNLGWGHTRNTALGITETGDGFTNIVRSDYLNESHIFGLSNIKIGYRGALGSTTGNIQEIGDSYKTINGKPNSIVRNFQIRLLNGKTTYTASDLRTFTMDTGGQTYYICYADAFRYMQICETSPLELDAQLIVTGTAGTETLHYVSLLQLDLALFANFSTSKTNALPEYLSFGNYPRANELIDWRIPNPHPLAVGELKELRPIKDIMPSNTDVKNSYRVNVVVHYKYTKINQDGSMAPPTEINIIGLNNVTTRPYLDLTKYWGKSPWGYVWGECLGFDGPDISSTTYWARFYKKLITNGVSSTSQYPGGVAVFHVPVPYQLATPEAITAFSVSNNLRIITRMSDGKTRTYKYTTSWAESQSAFIPEQFLGVDGTAEANVDTLKPPLFTTLAGLDVNKSIGAVGDAASHSTWAKAKMAEGANLIEVEWQNAKLRKTVTPPGTLDDTFYIASTQNTSNSVTFDQIMFIASDKLYSFVRTGSTTFYNEFPATVNLARPTKPISYYTRRLQYIFTDNVAATTVRLWYRVEFPNPGSTVQTPTGTQTLVLGTSTTFKYIYETRSIASNISISAPRMVQDDYGGRPLVLVDVTFPTPQQARDAFALVKYWKMYEDDSFTTNVLVDGAANLLENRIILRINVENLLTAASAALTLNLYLHAIDSFHIPFMLYSTGSIDGRPLSLGTIKVVIGSRKYIVQANSTNSPATSVIRTTMNQLAKSSGMQITTTGNTTNVASSRLEYVTSNENFYKDNFTSVNGSLLINGSGMFNTTIPFASLFPNQGALSFLASHPYGVMIHGGYTTAGVSQSQSSRTSNGTKKGIRLIVTDKAGRSTVYIAPQISISDKHRFVIAPPSGTMDIVEMDNATNPGTNLKIDPGEYFVPTSGQFAISFNFKCGPAYVQNSKYSVFYENTAVAGATLAAAVSGRLSTPTIRKWWIVGIPSTKSIYGFKTKVNPLNGAVLPDYGTLYDSIQTNTYASDISIDLFDKFHTLGATKELPKLGQEMYEEYLTSDSTAKILNHLRYASDTNSTDTNYNNGVVWVSGFYPDINTGSGYLVFKNKVFTTKYKGASILSGVIKTDRYGFYFIAQDESAVTTGIDIGKMHRRYKLREVGEKGPLASGNTGHFSYSDSGAF